MAHFDQGPNLAAAVGKNVYLRSTKNTEFETYMVARDTVPEVTLATGEIVKVLQPGTVMALITSGENEGKVGPYDAGLTGVFESAAVNVSTASGGTFTITVNGQTTAAIAYNASAAQVLAALEALSNVEPGDFTVTKASTTFTITWQEAGPQTDITANFASLTGGGSPAITITQGASDDSLTADGRQTAANIVGINDTYLPTQLMRRDVEIGVLRHGTCVQDWCIEYDAGAPVALTNTTADAMRGLRDLDLMFVPVNPEVA